MSDTDQARDIADFIHARLAEDIARDKRRRFFRNYRLRWDYGCAQAVTEATTWLDLPPATEHRFPNWRRAGDSWLRGIARNWKRHPDYRQEWKR